MQIVLVRHAIAVERRPGLDDTQRPLCERGVRRFKRVVLGLEQLGVRLDHTFHSPWLRALQTAELLSPISHGALEPTELLADDPGDELIELAQRFDDKACIGFVGHEPWMSKLLSLFLTGSTRYAEAMSFKKGGVAWLKGAPQAGMMTLRSVLPPRVLCKLDRDAQSSQPRH